MVSRNLRVKITNAKCDAIYIYIFNIYSFQVPMRRPDPLCRLVYFEDAPFTFSLFTLKKQTSSITTSIFEANFPSELFWNDNVPFVHLTSV